VGALPVAELRSLISGYRITQALHVAAVLGVPDQLADGPRTSDELATRVGAHAPSLYRLLRALAGVGVLEQDGSRFALAPLGEALRVELADWAAFSGSAPIWSAWGELLHSVRTGENAFRHIYGTDIWQFREEHPDESDLFDRGMVANTRLVAGAVVDACDFSRFGVVADIAGGRGALLSAILDANPEVRGILFDREHVVAHANLGDRATTVAGSFFDEVPGGADAYVLKDIVHDWEDPEAAQLLRVVRAAMSRDAVVLLVEKDLAHVETAFADLTMLVLPGGRERTTAEYETLLAGAGLRLTGVTPTSTPYAVFEAEPIQVENARSK
jgi:O-methyltransferase/methyltransferase family protein